MRTLSRIFGESFHYAASVYLLMRRREMLDSGIVPASHALDEVISDCWARFSRAQATVQANVPANYISSSALNPQAKPGPATKGPPTPTPPMAQLASHRPSRV